MYNLSLNVSVKCNSKNLVKHLFICNFYYGGIMFMGSFPFGGMLGSCRREGMCMLTSISEKDKLSMLIK